MDKECPLSTSSYLFTQGWWNAIEPETPRSSAILLSLTIDHYTLLSQIWRSSCHWKIYISWVKSGLTHKTNTPTAKLRKVGSSPNCFLEIYSSSRNGKVCLCSPGFAKEICQVSGEREARYQSSSGSSAHLTYICLCFYPHSLSVTFSS